MQLMNSFSRSSSAVASPSKTCLTPLVRGKVSFGFSHLISSSHLDLCWCSERWRSPSQGRSALWDMEREKPWTPYEGKGPPGPTPYGRPVCEFFEGNDHSLFICYLQRLEEFLAQNTYSKVWNEWETDEKWLMYLHSLVSMTGKSSYDQSLFVV